MMTIPGGDPQNRAGQALRVADAGTLMMEHGLDANGLSAIDFNTYDISPLPKEQYAEKYRSVFTDQQGRYDAKAFDDWYLHVQDATRAAKERPYQTPPYNPEDAYLPFEPYRAPVIDKPFTFRNTAFLGGEMMVSQEESAFLLHNNTYVTKEGNVADWKGGWAQRMFGNFVIDYDDQGVQFIRELPSGVPAHGYQHLSVWGPQHKYTRSLLEPVWGFLSGAVVETGKAIATLGYMAEMADERLMLGSDQVERNEKLRKELSPDAPYSLWGAGYNFFEKFAYKPSEIVKQGGFFAPQSIAYNVGNGIGMLMPQRFAASAAVKGIARAAVKKGLLDAAEGAVTRKSIRSLMKSQGPSYHKYIDGYLPSSKMVARGVATGIGTAQAMNGVWEAAMMSGLDEEDALRVAAFSLPAVALTEWALGSKWITEGIGRSGHITTKNFYADNFQRVPKAFLKSLATDPGKAMSYFTRTLPKMYENLAGYLNKVPKEKAARILQSVVKGTIREGAQEGPLEEGWYIFTEWLHDKYWADEGDIDGYGRYGTKLFDSRSLSRVGENAAAGALLGGLFDGVFIGSQRDADMSESIIQGLQGNEKGYLMNNYKYWKKEGTTTGSPDYHFDGVTPLTANTDASIEGITVNEDGSLDQFGFARGHIVKSQKDFNYYTWALATKYWQGIMGMVKANNPYLIKLYEENGKVIEPVMELTSQLHDTQLELNKAQQEQQASPTEGGPAKIQELTKKLEGIKGQFGYYVTPVKDGYSQALLDMVRNDTFTRALNDEAILKNEGGFVTYDNNKHDELFSTALDEDGKPKGYFPRIQTVVGELERSHLEALNKEQSGVEGFEKFLGELQAGLNKGKPKKMKDVAKMLNLALETRVTPYEERITPAQRQALDGIRALARETDVESSIEEAIVDRLVGSGLTGKDPSGQNPSIDAALGMMSPVERQDAMAMAEQTIRELGVNGGEEIFDLVRSKALDLDMTEFEENVEKLKMTHEQALYNAMGFDAQLAALVAISAFNQSRQPIPEAYYGALGSLISIGGRDYQSKAIKQLVGMNALMRKLATQFGNDFVAVDQASLMSDQDIATASSAYEMVEKGFSLKDTPDAIKKALGEDWNQFSGTLGDDAVIPGIAEAMDLARTAGTSLQAIDSYRRRRLITHHFYYLNTIVSALPTEDKRFTALFEAVEKPLEDLKSEIVNEQGEILTTNEETHSEQKIQELEQRLIQLEGIMHETLKTNGSLDAFIEVMVGSEEAGIEKSILYGYVSESKKRISNSKLLVSKASYDDTLQHFSNRFDDLLEVNHFGDNLYMSIKDRDIHVNSFFSYMYHELVRKANQIAMGNRESVYSLLSKALSDDVFKKEENDDKRMSLLQHMAVADALTYLTTDRKFIAKRKPLYVVGEAKEEKAGMTTYPRVELERDAIKDVKEHEYYLGGVQLYGNGGAGKSTVMLRAIMRSLAVHAKANGRKLNIAIVGQGDKNLAALNEAMAGLSDTLNISVMSTHAQFFSKELPTDIDLLIYDESTKISAPKALSLIQAYKDSNTKILALGDMVQLGALKGIYESTEGGNIIDKILPRTITVTQNFRTKNYQLDEVLNRIRMSINTSMNSMKQRIDLINTVYAADKTEGVQLIKGRWRDIAGQWLVDVNNDMSKELFAESDRVIIFDTKANRDAYYNEIATQYGAETIGRIGHLMHYLDGQEEGSAQGMQFSKVYVAVNLPTDGQMTSRRIYYTAASRAIDFLMLPTGEAEYISIPAPIDKLPVRPVDEQTTKVRNQNIDAFFSSFKDRKVPAIPYATGGRKKGSRVNGIQWDDRASVKTGNQTIHKGDTRSSGNVIWVVVGFGKEGGSNKVRVHDIVQDIIQEMDLESFISLSQTIADMGMETALQLITQDYEMPYHEMHDPNEPGGVNKEYSINKSARIHSASPAYYSYPISLASLTPGKVKKWSKEHIAKKVALLRAPGAITIVYHQELDLTDHNGKKISFKNGVVVAEKNGEVLGTLYYPYMNAQELTERNSTMEISGLEATWMNPEVNTYMNNLKALWTRGMSERGTSNSVVLHGQVANISVKGGTPLVNYNKPNTFQQTFDDVVARGGKFLSSDPSGNVFTDNINEIQIVQARGGSSIQNRLIASGQGANFLKDPNKVYTYAFMSLTPEIPGTEVPIEILGMRIRDSKQVNDKLKASMSSLKKAAEKAKSSKKGENYFGQFLSEFNKSYANQTVVFNRSVLLENGEIVPAMQDYLQYKNGHIEVRSDSDTKNRTDKADILLDNLQAALDYLAPDGYATSAKLEYNRSAQGEIEAVSINVKDMDIGSIQTPVITIQMPTARIDIDRTISEQAYTEPEIGSDELQLMEYSDTFGEGPNSFDEFTFDDTAYKYCK